MTGMNVTLNTVCSMNFKRLSKLVKNGMVGAAVQVHDLFSPFRRS